MLLGHPGAVADQLQIGLDHRRPAQRDGRVALVMDPAGELVALGGGGPLDPLQAPDRRAGGVGQHQPPARQTPLLGLGIQQRERQHAAGQYRGQSPARPLRQRPDGPIPVGRLDDPHVTELARGRGRGVTKLTMPVVASGKAPGPRGGGGGVKAPPAGQPPHRKCRRQGRPLLCGPAAQRREARAQRDREQDRRQQRSGGRWRHVEHDDRQHGANPDHGGLGPADGSEDSAPLQRAERVGQPALTHSRPSSGSWRGGRGSWSSPVTPPSLSPLRAGPSVSAAAGRELGGL